MTPVRWPGPAVGSIVRPARPLWPLGLGWCCWPGRAQWTVRHIGAIPRTRASRLGRWWRPACWCAIRSASALVSGPGSPSGRACSGCRWSCGSCSSWHRTIVRWEEKLLLEKFGEPQQLPEDGEPLVANGVIVPATTPSRHPWGNAVHERGTMIVVTVTSALLLLLSLNASRKHGNTETLSNLKGPATWAARSLSIWIGTDL